MKNRALLAVAAIALLIPVAACSGSEASGDGGDYPSEKLELAIPGGPGGGNDIMVRTFAKILEDEDLYPEAIEPTNRLRAGGGTTAWGDVFADTGNPYQMASTSSSFVTTPLEYETEWGMDSFTPIALLVQDDSIILTESGEGRDDWESWLEYASDKGTVTVGGVGNGADYVRQVSLAEQAGYEIDYVPFNEDGELVNGLLSGSLDAIISSPGSILGQVEAGKFSAILWTGPERLEDMPDVPSAAELGYEDLPGTPRGLVLPPDVSDEVVAWWRDTIGKVVETDAWQDYVKKNRLSPDVRYGEDFGDYLQETSDSFERILTEQGVL